MGRSICAPGGTSWPTTSPSPPRCWSVFIHRSESNLGPELGPAHPTVIKASRSGQQGRATARGGSHRANRRVCRQSCTRPVFWSPTRQQPALGQGLGGTKTGNESPLAPCSLYTNDMMVAIVSPPAALDRRVGMLVLVARLGAERRRCHECAFLVLTKQGKIQVLRTCTARTVLSIHSRTMKSARVGGPSRV